MVLKKRHKKQQPKTEEVSVKEEKKQTPVTHNSIVTKESFCAVVALFSVLSFFILITNDTVFGEPGGYMHALLMGLFGYMAYPIVLLVAYNCVMGFLGVKWLGKKKGLVRLMVTGFVGALLVHTVQTCYMWDYPTEGYLLACFNAGDAFPNITVAGWAGGLIVYWLSGFMTELGALVVLSALCLLCFYITVRPVAKRIGERLMERTPREPKSPKEPKQPKERKQKKAKKESVEQSADAGYEQPAGGDGYPQERSGTYASRENAQREWGEAPYASGAGAQARYGANEYAGDNRTYREENEQPLEGYTGSGVAAQNMGGYAPYVPYTVRRPGFTMSGQNDAGASAGQPANVQSQPPYAQASQGQAPYGQSQPQAPGAQGMQGSASPDGGYSPFGAMGQPQQPNHSISPEESRKILFGGTPAQNYYDNLIYDGNANVNRRDSSYNPPYPMAQSTPTASYSSTPTPTASYGSAPTQSTATYSEQYRQSMQDVGSSRPRKVVGDSGENFGRKTPNPYGLDEPKETSYNYGRTPERSADYSQPSRTPTYPTEQPSRVDASVEGRSAGQSFGGFPSPRIDAPLGEQSRMSESFGQREPEPRVDETVREAPALETDVDAGRRHRYMDTFSMQNPNIFGQSGNRARGEEEVAATDRSMIFEDEPMVETPKTEQSTRSVVEDPYSLRSFDEEPKSFSRDAVSSDAVSSRRVTPIEEPESIVVEPKVEKPIAPISSRMERGYTQETPSSALTAGGRTAASTPVEEEKPAPKPRIHKPYVRVPLHYFNCSDNVPDSDAAEVEDIKTRIIETLQDYNVAGGSIASVTFGPTVTRYNVVLPRGVSPKKVVSLEQEIAMGLCREGVNVYPNVEDGAVSIEVPNRNRQTVELGCMFIDDAYTKAKPTSLVFAMGKDIANRKVYGDVCKMTHLLVAGSSGSGKSVFLGCLIISLITKYSPDEMRLILIDPKKTEFVLYNGLPHLMVNEIITDCKKAVQSLSWAIGEMERRYSLIEKKSLSGTYVVNIDEYNANLAPGEEKLPKIVIIVDELADLMLNAKKDMEDKIQSLTQKARAAGIHLILATQRPSTDVITGVIKSNLPTRIAFTVATDVDSRVILDQTGAQKLLGKGDMVYTASGINTPVRVQSPFISSSDSQKVVNFIKDNNEAYFDESATSFLNNTRSIGGGEGGDACGGEVETVYLDALKLVIQTQTASISMLQRKCSIGFNKAGKIIEWMEMMEFISPYEGAKARRVLITREKFIELYGEGAW